jgi:SPP1 family predicted phage head-tail adaptor
MVGGNIEAVLQRKEGFETNSIGERIHNWVDVVTILGWLDLSTGDSRYTNNTKLQESTHVFITDYTPIDRNTSNKRLVVNGAVYDVLLIDDPMELHQHLEILLKYVGDV